jgi:hypothetical protein
MADPVTSGDESPAMRAFLAERRAGVIERAIATLDSCSDDALPAEAHRLAGTLGIFGFAEASDALRALQRMTESADVSHDAISQERAATLAMLRHIDADVAREGQG